MTTRNMPIVDWLEIESAAPAKIIISGEYSVVYDKQAIATAIDLKTRVTIRPNKDGLVRLELKNLNNVREWPVASFNTCRVIFKYNECLDYSEEMPVKLYHLLHSRYCKQPETSQTGDNTARIFDKKADDAVIAFLLLYIGLGDSYASSARPALDIEVDSGVPVGSGLGSSSAYSVALCGALMRVYRVAAEKHVISSWAFNIDKYFHGKPSGVDNSVVTSGGYILFQSGKFKTSSATHRGPIKVMLIDTGISRSTKKLSEKVIKQLKEDPNKVNGIFDNINDLTTQIWRNINETGFAPRNIAVFLHANQQLLNALQVGHERLTDICTRAQNHGLTAKQTGAGGGGIAFVLYDDSNNCQNVVELRAELQAAGYSVHDHLIGCEGLTVKMTPDPAFNFG